MTNFPTTRKSLGRRQFIGGSLALVGAARSVAADGLPANRDARRLARAIMEDRRLDTILTMARALLGEGLSAGSHYPETWIRDLNTFIEVGLRARPAKDYREALRLFFLFQGPTGDIPDGYVPASGQIERHYRTSEEAPGLFGHKNSVEVDQESSLVQCVARYVRLTGDHAFLAELIDGETVLRRLERALEWVMQERWAPEYGMVWAATKIDWGDVQPEDDPGDQIDDLTHPALGIYDNAFFVVAIAEFLTLVKADSVRSLRWQRIRDKLKVDIRRFLWRGTQRGFLPHIYLAKGSPFPADFDESVVYYHGGTAVAIEAGILRRSELLPTLERMESNARATGAATIGLTVYPAYRTGLFKNSNVREAYTYQNGGDWDWFGARMIRQLTENGFVEDAYRAFQPMMNRTIKAGDFYEWWSLENLPKGSRQYRGAAGVMGTAALALRNYARARSPR